MPKPSNRIRVVGQRRAEPDLRKLARALLELAGVRPAESAGLPAPTAKPQRKDKSS